MLFRESEWGPVQLQNPKNIGDNFEFQKHPYRPRRYNEGHRVDCHSLRKKMEKVKKKSQGTILSLATLDR